MPAGLDLNTPPPFWHDCQWGAPVIHISHIKCACLNSVSIIYWCLTMYYYFKETLIFETKQASQQSWMKWQLKLYNEHWVLFAQSFFGVRISSICLVVSHIYRAIANHLARKYISSLSEDCLKLMVDGFQSWLDGKQVHEKSSCVWIFLCLSLQRVDTNGCIGTGNGSSLENPNIGYCYLLHCMLRR